MHNACAREYACVCECMYVCMGEIYMGEKGMENSVGLSIYAWFWTAWARFLENRACAVFAVC